MDRQMVFPGAIPLETDLLNVNKHAYRALAKFAAAVLGSSTLLNGLACTADSPASLHVIVGAGEIYGLQNVDDTAYSAIAADTTHQIVKQGLLLDAVTLSCPAPGTGGQSINYLIQVGFSEVDTDSAVLEYYNASNPDVPWSGPSNSGNPNNARRADKCIVAVKAGVAAATGSQTTPAPDAGYTGAYVVVVANGATTIVSGDITRYTNAPFIDEKLGDKISKATADALYAPLSGAGSTTKSVAGSSNVTLSPTEYAAGVIILTGLLTGNINVVFPTTIRQWEVINETTGAFTITLKTAGGTGVSSTGGTQRNISGDGTNIVASDTAMNLAAGSTAATASPGDNTTKVATTAFVTAAVAAEAAAEAALQGSKAIGLITIAANVATLQGGSQNITSVAWQSAGVIRVTFGAGFVGLGVSSITNMDSGTPNLVYKASALATPSGIVDYTFRALGGALTNPDTFAIAVF